MGGGVRGDITGDRRLFSIGGKRGDIIGGRRLCSIGGKRRI